jgi:hypothetical protein
VAFHLQVFQSEFYMHIASLPCVLHVSPISFS